MTGGFRQRQGSATYSLQVLSIRAEQDSGEAIMTDDDRTAPDCSGYVVVDTGHGATVSVTPYSPPAPRKPGDDEKA
jgi:hypothetical protein